MYVLSESAGYSIHLKKSITWSACGNGQKRKNKKIKWERDSHNNQFWTVGFRICSGFVCWVVVMCMLKELG